MPVGPFLRFLCLLRLFVFALLIAAFVPGFLPFAPVPEALVVKCSTFPCSG